MVKIPDEVQVSDDISAFVLAAKDGLKFNSSTLLQKYRVQELTVEIHNTIDSVWMIASSNNQSCTAFRLCYSPGKLFSATIKKNIVTVKAPIGTFTVTLDFDKDKTILHYCTHLVPAENLIIPYYPRDVYPLNKKNNKLQCEGIVYAEQRGPKGGFLFFSLLKPLCGTYLYMQDFTSLNTYFSYTKTTPENTVGGEWPELGFSLPPSGENFLPKGKKIIISDAYISYTPEIPQKDTEAGKLFLQLLADIYPRIRKPRVQYVDWIEYARKTAISLQAKQALTRVRNLYYLNAYTATSTKPPESMVQLSIHVPSVEFEHWKGKPLAIKNKIEKNIGSFYNKNVNSIVRWLPGAKFHGDHSEEQSHDKMDSWYLYHTLMNYGRLAQLGNKEARKLFLDSVDYAVKVGRHFNYSWPIFFDINTLAVIKDNAKPSGLGEIDVGGLYCKVMMLAYRMTKNEEYLDEAKTSVKKMKSLGFGLLYQTNTTLLGASAMAELYNTTADETFLELSILCVANVIYNAWLWECNYGYARGGYSTFFGLPPLHDAKYIACFEETESLATLLYYLEIIGNMLPESVIMLCSEYMKHLLFRGKYYFPANLPEEAIAKNSREGIINRRLTLPLEDIYEGWEQAGQVGQEIYGSATPFIAVTCAYKNFKEIPFIVYCSYPVLNFTYNNGKGNREGTIKFKIIGSNIFKCDVRLIERGRKFGGLNILCFINGRKASVKHQDGHLIFPAKGKNNIEIEWSYKNNKRRK